MKLKKSISLLLVLALSLMSFTFIVAADGDTVNVAIVAEGDTSALEADNTFVANVELTDIAANQLYGAQLTINFDPEVLQVVNEAGEATETVADAFVPCEDVYADGEGYFAYSMSAIDNEEGTISFVAAKAGALIENLEAKVECPEGSYTLGGIRFKVVSTGQSGIEIVDADTEIYCAYSDALADVTNISEAIRIGLPAITAVADPEGAVNVDVDTAKEAVIAELPATVTVTYEDESEDDVAVTWDCDDYDAEVPGEYTFIGTIARTELTASVTVNVNKIAIESASEVGTVYVPNGASNEEILSLLPETVEVTLANDATDTVAVDWVIADGTGENALETEKTVAIEGTLDAGTKYTNEGDAVKASATLEISAAIAAPTEGTVETEIEDEEVAYNTTTKDDIIANLPKTVEIAVGNITVIAFITWECDDYNAAQAGDYTFVGTIQPVNNVDLASGTIEVIVTVQNKAIASVETLTNKVISVGDGLLIDLFDDTVEVEYQDGSTGTETIVWNEETMELTAEYAGTYILRGTVGDRDISVQVTVREDQNYDGVVITWNNQVIRSGATLTMFTNQVYALQTSIPVVWSSSIYKVAHVRGDNKLLALTPGTVRIYASTAEGVVVGYFDVRVIWNPSTVASVGESVSEEIVIPFTDLADYSWAARMICVLENKGVVSGKTDTLYAPGDNVTRAEYASLLVRAMKLSANVAGKEFTDVAQGEWYYNAVQTASALGIVSGYEDGSFRPNNSITREEMAVMTLRAAEAAGRNVPAKATVSFNDADQISGFAKDAVNKLAAGQIINGMGDNNFAPQQTANRAQAAVIIYQLCEL